MGPVAIIAATFAIWAYMKLTGQKTQATPPVNAFGSQNLPQPAAPPAVTDSTAGISNDPTVTNQPNAASGGGPVNTPFARQFGNDTPGWATNAQPFYGSHRDLFVPDRPFAGKAAKVGKGGCGGNCGGGCGGSKPGGCVGCKAAGRGGCTSSPSAPGNINVNAPTIIGGSLRDAVSNPFSLDAQLVNIAGGIASPFNAWQWGMHELETADGGVPAAPSYHG